MVGRFAVLVDVEAFPFHFLGGTQPDQDIGDLERHERDHGRPYDRDTYALRLYHELVPDGGGADLARDPVGDAGSTERLMVEYARRQRTECTAHGVHAEHIQRIVGVQPLLELVDAPQADEARAESDDECTG